MAKPRCRVRVALLDGLIWYVECKPDGAMRVLCGSGMTQREAWEGVCREWERWRNPIKWLTS
jgi:hypothetical protein